MANPRHFDRLRQALLTGPASDWDAWRWKKTFNDGIFGTHPAMVADLSNSDLRRLNEFGRLDFTRVNLKGARLQSEELGGVSFRRADLRGTHFEHAYLSRALFTGADMRGTFLEGSLLPGADLAYADMRGAQLQGANLSRTTMVETNLEGANLNNCKVYGASVWAVKLDKSTQQRNLLITPPYEENVHQITVDSLEVAQFIYLLLENRNLRNVIDTISSKVVLILGRFTSPHKAILDVIRDRLRDENLTPVIFDFKGPSTKTVSATVTTLAHMAKFIIADITEPKSIPQELTEITHALPGVPIQPIIRAGMPEWSMFGDLKDRGIVLGTLRYRNVSDVRENLVARIVQQVQEFIERAVGQPTGKAELINENDRLKTEIATQHREIAQLLKTARSKRSSSRH
jgi:uncharacterized protein YjbI with pentapeptide repeats